MVRIHTIVHGMEEVGRETFSSPVIPDLGSTQGSPNLIASSEVLATFGVAAATEDGT